jgi:hypothetical protein
MPVRRPARVALAVLAAGAVLTGCGRRGLDDQQQRVEARECASLLERNASRTGKAAAIKVDGRVLDLADPEAFSAALGDLRGPADFPMDDRRTFRNSRSALIGDLCKSESVTTSTTSTTSPATQPATGADG